MTRQPNSDQAAAEVASELRGWFAGRLPADWFDGPPEVVVDREEVTVVGQLAEPETSPEADDAERAAARRGRATAFREQTRDERVALAREVEHRYGRSVAWGVRVGEDRMLFTHLAVPVMTRLRQPERQVLDVLVASGVARSRADALAWCVRLVGEHADTWLSQLRDALDSVDRLRASGPGVAPG